MAKKNISEWSITPGSNLDLNNISVDEGWLPSTVNNFEREELSQLAKFYDDFGGVNTIGGTANAVTVTTGTVFTALATGMRMRVIPTANNTGAVTLNLDAVGAKAVRKIIGGTDVALISGDLMAGQHYDIVYSTAANAAAGGWIIMPSAWADGYETRSIGSPGTSISLTAASVPIQEFTGIPGGANTLDMPVTSTLFLGQTWTLLNNTDSDLNVRSSGANAIFTIRAGASAIITCALLSGTTAASWIFTQRQTPTNVTSTGFRAYGTSTNDSAAVGLIGELIASSVASGSAVALTTATDKTVTSISLTAGDWDVSGVVQFSSAAGTSITIVAGSQSTTNNTLDTNSSNFLRMAAFVPGSTTQAFGLPLNNFRYSLSGTTTIYLIASATFTVSTLSAWGSIRARRAR